MCTIGDQRMYENPVILSFIWQTEKFLHHLKSNFHLFPTLGQTFSISAQILRFYCGKVYPKHSVVDSFFYA